MKNKYLYHLLIALDQLANAIFVGAADETISSRCYRGAVLAKEPKLKWRIAYKVVNALFFDSEHCKTAYESEVKRRQYPAEFHEI
ncbi:DNA helicase UvrD [Actinobacillus equuli subsp. haemolyticus]|uniref:DNA helicase UvrD n=1 Tax=Actinobacillus equuli TaxID=718 RepID=UPI0024434ADD|nr:DNA helicase UvrD [Actinobacillus equuli]WGE78052.1 DNA helicase UvrD [Actinobacillus equuli subsp. haemolyticus]